MQTFTNGHALLVGVGSYQNAKWNAPVTVADASGVADALRDPQIGAYPPDQVTFLHDADATTQGVIAALKALATRTTAQDTVFIFFCGHGALDANGVYRFATHDAVFEGSAIKAGTGLSAPDLLTLLRAIPVQKLLLALNACFSGHLGPVLGSDAQDDVAWGAPVAAILGPDVLATGEGRALITASRPTQYSRYLRTASYTFFGKALIEGLRGAAARGGQVGLYDLYQHIYTEVGRQAAAIDKVQEPVLTITQGVGLFPLAQAPAGSGGLGAPLQEPPSNTAAEVYPRTAVQAWGQGAQAAVAHGGNVTQNKLIDFGNAQIKGGVSIRDVAGGDMTKITVNVNAANAAHVQDKPALLAQIATARDAVAQLGDAPKGQRRDIEYALDSAHDAGDEGDDARMLEKLNDAQRLLLKLSATVPAARPLSDTVGALIQRAMGILSQPTGRTHNQHISGNAQVDFAVAGDVHGDITLNQPRGDKVHGDKVMGDKVINYGAPRPAATDADSINGLINDNRRRLRALEQRAARMGYNTPPEVTNEIEDIRIEIARLEALQENSNTSRASASSFEERRLDAAIPKKVQKDQFTELRTMIALAHSEGLRARLPDFTSTGEVITKEDVQGTSIQVEFKTNVTRLLIEIDATDFQVVKPEQVVIVPQGIESGVVVFSLLPRKLSTNAKIFLRVFTMPPDRALIDTLVLEANIQPRMVSQASWIIVSRLLFFR